MQAEKIMLVLLATVLALSQGEVTKRYMAPSCKGKQSLEAVLPKDCDVGEKMPIELQTGCPIFKVACNTTIDLSALHPKIRSQMPKLLIDEEADIVPKQTIPESQFQTEARAKYNNIKNALNYNDPSFGKQWAFLSDGSVGAKLGFDMNVGPLHVKNIRGQGVTILPLDDGLLTDNPDIRDSVDNSLLKIYGTASSISGSHGTSVTGLFASKTGNGFCNVGIAPAVKTGMQKILTQGTRISDVVEALLKESARVHVYSNSWGPVDDGVTTSSANLFYLRAVKQGSEKGRGNKGNFYNWAAGNGGNDQDSCGADGMINLPYSFATSSVDESGNPSFYAEICSAIAVSAYVGNTDSPTTSYQSPFCISNFRGTSAACPMISGVAGLVYQMNSDLTWRDVHHILIWAARMTQSTRQLYQVNGGGLIRSDVIGYGVPDATRAARLSKGWKNVDFACIVRKTMGTLQSDWAEGFGAYTSAQSFTGRTSFLSYLDTLRSTTGANIMPMGSTLIRFNIASSDGEAYNPAQQGSTVAAGAPCKSERVEVAVVSLQITSWCRGSLAFLLVSPSGMISILHNVRPKDVYAGQFTLTLKSSSFYNEEAPGTWTLRIIDRGTCNNPVSGTSQVDPASYRVTGKIAYAQFELWTTSEAGSAYVRNKAVLEPLLLTVGKTAMTNKKAKILSTAELIQSVNESKVKSLREEAPTP